MKGEELFDAIELGQTAFGKTPKGFDAVDVDAAGSESFGLVNAHMFVVADIDQTVVAAPIIGENNAGRIDIAAQNGVESGGRAVGHDLGVDAALTFIDAKDRLLESAATTAASAWTTAQPGRAEVTFIDLDDADKTAQLGKLIGKNQATKKGVVAINGVAIKAQKHSCFRRLDVEAKAFDEFTKSMSA
jgi:hypothetical protein